MALDKDDLNNALKKEKRVAVVSTKKKQYKYVTTQGVDEDGFGYTLTQRVEVKPGESLSSIAGKTQKQTEETFAKRATKVGKEDGEVLGGVKSLGKETISPKEVTDTSVGQITDKVGGLTGTKTPSASLASLTGLPAQVAGDKAKSGIVGIGSGSPTGVASLVAVGKDKKGDLTTEVSDFATGIADSGESSSIQSSLPEVDFGDLTDTVKDISPVSSITGKLSDVVDNVSNDTGIDGLTSKTQKSENGLSFFKDAKSLVSSSLTDQSSAIKDTSSAIDKSSVNQTNKFGRGIQSGFLQNIGETITGAAKGFIATIVPGGVSLNDDEYAETFAQLTAKDDNEKTKAVKSLTLKSPNLSNRMKSVVNNTNASSAAELQVKVVTEAKIQGIPQEEIDVATDEIATIDTATSQLDTTIGGTLVVDAKLFDDGVPISDNNQKWSGRTSPDDVFTYVSSVEELDTEFAKVSRDVTEVVIHATETYSNKNIGAIEINNIHNELGHDGIGYHYVIRRDGRLQRGRPVNRKGEHAPINGHDDLSIGIVMVGGLDSPSGSASPKRSGHTFTRTQFTTLERFISSFYRKFPGGQAFGHNDIDVNELDPYFDVVDYVESIFRKKNKVADPLTRGPLTPIEIIKGAKFIPKSQRLEEREDVASELENADDIEIEERQSNVFERPPKPEGFPKEEENGTIYDYEWDDGSRKWVQSVDYSNVKEEQDVRAVSDVEKQIAGLEVKRASLQTRLDSGKETTRAEISLEGRIERLDRQINNLKKKTNVNSPNTTKVYGVEDFDEDL